MVQKNKKKGVDTEGYAVKIRAIEKELK
jgi:hypothetical protein